MHYDIRQLSTTHTILVQEDNDQELRQTVVHVYKLFTGSGGKDKILCRKEGYNDVNFPA